MEVSYITVRELSALPYTDGLGNLTQNERYIVKLCHVDENVTRNLMQRTSKEDI